MATYRIIGKKSGWIAQRDFNRFNGNTEVTLADGLSLKEAQGLLLDYFNMDYDTCYQNWGLVRCNHPYNSSSYSDGTRSYDYDGRCYSIVEDNVID